MDQNYHDKIKAFILDQLIPVAGQNKDHQLSLSEIHNLVINVLPAKWIDQTDVYNALTDLGFSPLIQANNEGKLSSFYCLGNENR